MSISEDTVRQLRALVTQNPDMILGDPDLMRALVDADGRAKGPNVVDLRGAAMLKLEQRLDRLEEAYRTVIGAAYENLAGMNQIHRIVLRMLEQSDFQLFLKGLDTEIAEMMRVAVVRLMLETKASGFGSNIAENNVLLIVKPGTVNQYAGTPTDRLVTLIQCDQGSPDVYGEIAPQIKSEACLRLDLGQGRLPGMLLLGSTDRNQFTPQHGTDLLCFLGGVLERTLRRWLE